MQEIKVGDFVKVNLTKSPGEIGRIVSISEKRDYFGIKFRTRILFGGLKTDYIVLHRIGISPIKKYDKEKICKKK